MPTNVVMPQMGESIAEGTIVRWIKKVGDDVDRDEPLFEISTDKVDAEIPSPAAGRLAEIRVKEGETVPVNSVVAVIGGAGEAIDCCSGPRYQSRQRSRHPPRSPALQPPRRRRLRKKTPRPTRMTPETGIGRSHRRSCAASPASTASTSRRSRARASTAASRSRTSSTSSPPGHRRPQQPQLQ